MKTKAIRQKRRFLLSILFILSIPVNFFPQEFKTVKDGIEYAEVTREISGLKVNMNLLRLDLHKVRLNVRHAMDAAIGTEKTSSIATRQGAFAAINAGFFRMDNSIFAGDPAGVLKVDGKLLSESNNNRIALFLSNKPAKTEVSIAHLNIWMYLTVGSTEFRLEGINRSRNENDLVLYTPEFHRTTLTDAGGLEIVIRRNRVEKIINGKGSTPIPQGGFVLSVSGKQRDQVWKYSKVGAKIDLILYDYDFHSSRIDLAKPPPPPYFWFVEDIVGGVPQLIKNGKIDITWEQEKTTKSFVETRHPRTAVARLKDGKFLMITVDGRSESSGGISLNDLAAYLLELGATDAMNLDGGGSTTMFLDGKVVNHPSDKEGERKVSDAILVFPRQKRPGKAN